MGDCVEKKFTHELRYNSAPSQTNKFKNITRHCLLKQQKSIEKLDFFAVFY